ncbi:unnamed protein product, partial [Discosporangium mesarthrocarpum]
PHQLRSSITPWQRPCPNEAAAKKLEEMAHIFEVAKGQGDQWRGMTFRRAAGALRRLDVEITSVAQLEGLKRDHPYKCRGLGSSTMDILQDFLTMGRSSRLDGLR